MRILTDNGAFVLAEHEQRLLFIVRYGLVPAWAIFVTGLLTAIFGINGLLMLVFGVINRDERLFVGLGLSTAGALLAWACVTLTRRRKARREQPLEPSAANLVIDKQAGVVRDASGVLAPIDQTRFVLRRQISSSSRALHVVWPRGERVLYRGDPFSGTAEDAADALQHHGIKVS